ncbi:MAG: hypothetical protein GVY19_05135 [Bacteroidetes bacterium]|jgi:hypothetical protein|nr:hypothetical protein [Bacteroidota bacterium]
MSKLISVISLGFLALACWQCVDSTLCTSRTIAPVYFDFRIVDDGEPADTIIDSLTITGQLNNQLPDTHLIQDVNISSGELVLAPLEREVDYTYWFNNIIRVDFRFYYQQQAEFLNDACGFIYEYTIDSMIYDQINHSATFSIPIDTLYDTTFYDTTYNNMDTMLIDTVFTTVLTQDTTIHYGKVIDSVVILNPKILIDNVETNLEIYINPGN